MSNFMFPVCKNINFSNIIGSGAWFENEVTKYIRDYARMEEIEE